MMKKKILSFALAFCLLLGLFPLAARAAEPAYDGGSGTEADPYLISTAEQLREFAEVINEIPEAGSAYYKLTADNAEARSAYYKLTADIDLSGLCGEAAGGASWEPIAINYYDFTGTFDGGGHTVSGLYIHDPEIDLYVGCGLFGFNGGTIKNLTVSGEVTGYLSGGIAEWCTQTGSIENCRSLVRVVGDQSSGGIAGTNEGVVKNCVNSASVTGNKYGGGIVGENYGVLENCTNSGAVTGGESIGGIAGDNDGTIKKCGNSGSVEGEDFVGGVTGQNFGTVENCFNSGSVAGSRSTGGIVGDNHGLHTPTGGSISPVVKNCFNTGAVLGGGSTGDVIGSDTGAAENCYYLAAGTNGEGGEGVYPKTAAQFASGEVTYLLQAAQADPEDLVWGQELNKDQVPVLTEQALQRVLKASFVLGSEVEYGAAYTNVDGTVTFPARPTMAGKVFEGWFLGAADTSPEFSASTRIQKDITLYAHWKEGGNTTGGNSGGSGGETLKGLPYYVRNGQDVFIGFSSGEGKTAKYIAPSGATVLFRENPKSFADVSGHWAESDIEFVAQRELFVGTASTAFSPDTGMTRAMFAAVIGRLYERSYGLPELSGTLKFTDVNYESYYGKYLDWAVESGIVAGVGEGRFAPDKNITRQEMAAMLYRFAAYLGKLPDSDETVLTYPDSGKIAGWAEAGALYCQQTGIIAGREGGNFAPSAVAARAEVSAMLKRFIVRIVE